MSRWHDARGATLLETLLAASLLVALVGGVATLLLLAHRFSTRSEQATTAALAAAAGLERLRAVPWTFDMAGRALETPVLSLSPPGSLEGDLNGYYDWLDAAGRLIEPPGADTPVFIRRWAVVPAADGASDVRGVEACVFAWPAAPGAPPLVCLSSMVARQP